MSIGEILSAPIVPSCTSSLPIAEIASRKRSASRGAVTKFMWNLSKMKVLTLPVPPSTLPYWRGWFLGDLIRRETSECRTKSESREGIYIDTSKGNSTVRSIKGQTQRVRLIWRSFHLLVRTKTISVTIDRQSLMRFVSSTSSISFHPDPISSYQCCLSRVAGINLAARSASYRMGCCHFWWKERIAKYEKCRGHCSSRITAFLELLESCKGGLQRGSSRITSESPL